jgi:hypothetical protein
MQFTDIVVLETFLIIILGLYGYVKHEQYISSERKLNLVIKEFDRCRREKEELILKALRLEHRVFKLGGYRPWSNYSRRPKNSSDEDGCESIW